MILSARVRGISVWGPRLEGWAASRAILAGDAVDGPHPTPPPLTTLLSATERRRAGPVVRLALAAAHEAAESSGLPLGSFRAVFGSSNGDGPVVGSILAALADAREGERVVSPTQFHNSVHNAPAGYWAIATGGQLPATCIGCHDDTFAASLLAAMADLATSGAPTMLCCYDFPLPAPIDLVRPSGPPFAAAFALSPSGPGPALIVRQGREPARTTATLLGPELQALARVNPAARSLHLLAALARQRPCCHDIPYLGGHLSIEVRS